ncbi:MAG: arylsulfatase [Phycisphaerales bacterium]|nr:MAG: arylsulfatase [Phycisphaerales bacterium]
MDGSPPRVSLRIACIGAALLVSSPALWAGEEPAGRPNIVFILADDLGYGDLRCLNGESKIPTPNMDRLFAEGIHFTDAHSPSAVCTPTRYGLLTGRYAWRTQLKQGVLMGYDGPLIEPDRVTVASLLKESGYRTACIGKWHLGLGWATKDGAPRKWVGNDGSNTDFTMPIDGGPCDLGFDYFFGISASLDMAPYCYIENDRVTQIPSGQIDASKMPAYWRAGPIAPDFTHEDVLPALTQKALEWIDQAGTSESRRPFFLYLPLTAPHTPWLPVEEFRGSSEAGPYGDFTAQVDWTVGKVLKALDRNGLAASTLIIMTSDNGAYWSQRQIEQYDHRANHTFRGQKADIWEGGHRIPFIARWPGRIEPGAKCEDTICLVDLLATFAAIAGQVLPEGAGGDSYSILPRLLGDESPEPIREATVHHSISGVFAIRQGPWKLILGRGSGGFTQPKKIDPKEGEPIGQLYNLQDDPAETTNLYLQRPEVVERLTELLNKYREQGHSRQEVNNGIAD